MQELSRSASVLGVMLVYLGAVMGAGFATGQEILQFFIRFGQDGLRGAVLAALLFAYMGGLVMFLATAVRASSYGEVLAVCLGTRFSRLVDIMSLAMLPCGFVVMLSGAGAVFSEQIGLPGVMGVVLTAIVTAGVLSRGLNGMVAASAVIVPVKVILIIAICLTALADPPFSPPAAGAAVLPATFPGWAWSAVIYVSYNMIVPLAVLSSMGKRISMVSGVAGGVLGGLFLGAVVWLVAAAGQRFYPQIGAYEIPMLFMAENLGPLKNLLGPLVWMAILTTAIGEVHGFASRLGKNSMQRYKRFAYGLVLCALPFSALKFSLLVKILYPLFGYMGLVLLAFLFFFPPLRAIRRKTRQSV